MRRMWLAALVLSGAVTAAANPEMDVTLPGGATMTFVRIEPGTFLMGSADDDATKLSGETPQHQVTLTRGYWLAKYEITQAQWLSVTGDNPSQHEGLDHPVDHVSWNDVQAFAAALNADAGADLYRMPTEAEWEYACRAGSATPWPFGDDSTLLIEYAWCSLNNTAAGLPAGTKRVGTKLPNAWGLHDMLGNVTEWCQGPYGDYTSEPQVDPQGDVSGTSTRMPRRGGHFYGNDRMLRSATRNYDGPTGRDHWLGARLLRVDTDTRPTPVPGDTWGRVKRGR